MLSERFGPSASSFVTSFRSSQKTRRTSPRERLSRSDCWGPLLDNGHQVAAAAVDGDDGPGVAREAVGEFVDLLGGGEANVLVGVEVDGEHLHEWRTSTSVHTAQGMNMAANAIEVKS